MEVPEAFAIAISVTLLVLILGFAGWLLWEGIFWVVGHLDWVN